MSFVTLTSYAPDTGCLVFSVSNDQNTVLVEKSINGGSTWTSEVRPAMSPQCGFTVLVDTMFRLRLYDGTVSNIISYTIPVPISVIRTPIENETDISLCNSPIHIRLQNAAKDNTILSATVRLWTWNGDQDKVLGEPNRTLYADKVSQSDKYINFEISELIKSFLISPSNAPNTNQPTFSYNELSNPAITGQGVFWQIIADVESQAGIERQNFRTSFATLGYRYDYEQTASNVYNPDQPYTPRWYDNKIHNYIKQQFDLTKTVEEATSKNIIQVVDVTPSGYLREALDPYLIVYLNKAGLWDMFTPYGKVTWENKKAMSTNNLGMRDPSQIDTAYSHMKLTDNFDVTQTVTINTGSLFQEMVEQVEQIVYSPKIYLIKFNGDLQETSTIGVTIDNTFITIDDLTVTIDSETVSEEYTGVYKTHRQIPVILSDTDFMIKTRLNDKNKIDYNLKFELTTNKINDIR